MKNEIKIGQIAYVRTTEEPVFVMDIYPKKPDYPGLGGMQATVRRPRVSEDGRVDHVITEFYLEELETAESRHSRNMADVESFRAQFQGFKRPPNDFGSLQ